MKKLLFIALLPLLFVGCKDDNEPKPTPEKKKVEQKIAYLVNDQKIDPTQDVADNKEDYTTADDGHVEMASPYIVMKFDKEFFGKEVEADFEMLDHKGSKDAGMTSVCFGSCVSADFVEHFHADKVLIDKELNDQGGYSVQLHFGVKGTIPSGETYRVKMTTKSEGKEIGTLTFAFTTK